MSLASTSIQRPVLATVFSLVILLFGGIGITYLGVREFPSVDPPLISVNTSYPGANSDVIETQITEPLEQSINGIPGIKTLTSRSSQGRSSISVEFELTVDMETAANDVRDKVSQAQRFLPRDCDPPTVSKADADASPIMMIAVQSPKRSLLELSEIADLTFKEQLQTISGVSAVQIWGEKRYAMRLWLDPAKLAGYQMTPLDVRNAILRENVELPAGSVEGNTTELTIRTLGLMTTPAEFNNLIIRQVGDQLVRVRDVGRAELGPEDLRGIMKMNGVPMVSTVIIPQPGANHIDIVDEVYKRLEYIKKDLPNDVVIDIGFDNTQYIRSSIREVLETIYIAFALVVFIIFLFLRDWRTTMIPILVIPVSLVGAFFVMYLAEFTINVLTLLAIVLSIGLVVDDAIIMMENIYVKIEKGMTPMEAGLKGSNEIYFAIIATTITLVAVFIPIVFLEGMTGRLFREFSIVIAGSVTISAFVALTLTPMLSTKLLKIRKTRSKIYNFTEKFFVKLNTIYRNSLDSFLKKKYIAIVILLSAFGLILWLWNSIPAEMAPLEDRSQMNINITSPEGSTYEYNLAYVEDLASVVERTIPEADKTTTMIRGGGGFVRIVLVSPDMRDRTQQEIANQLTRELRKKTKARANVMQQSTFGGRRAGMPIQYVLQAPNIEKLREILPAFMAKVQDNPTFVMADVNLKFTKPEIQIEINRDKANLLGVSTQNIGQTLQLALSGQRFGYFIMNGKQYQIFGELARQDRNKPLDLKSLYVRNNTGQMIQLDNFVNLKETTAPPQLFRYNRFVAATISAGLAEGKTISQGLEEMDKIAAEVLDDTFRTALAGDSKDFMESSSSLMFAFILAIVLIFLVLSAQFESFKDPVIVMMTVPLALTGALIFMWYFGITMNIFSQIGLIMLIGLVSKNGILIVEFANQRKEAGMNKHEAIRYASAARFRPILMTSLSTILGILPLAMGWGEGAQSRVAMGIAVVGGLTLATFLTLYVVPAIYLYISSESKHLNREKMPDDSTLATTSQAETDL
ncbi:MAG TPA: efflux RND transporter permease subunit [Prolixibacteraceae bacterium]|nr:efflux RND transporter permease subunit [Prolixibacteraceae bacterium]HOS00721.1 efflux RND transporter permease subunit [Prolixibacteraceae bacterium]HOS90357.1 efflux RND transporter permease subunit [Prolixibacteraceae bacterium]HPL44874.1 efflux RND transporter permease subunit [Prolixibacteraceae bacterium]HQH76155.1 efflux RND transporter permease subunit [Prolixibacteraceae bacterium]